MAEPIQRNHRVKIRTFSIIGRVFIPVGAVLLAAGIITLCFGFPTLLEGIAKAPEADSGCVFTEFSFHCDGGPVAAMLSGGIIMIVYGWLGFSFGLTLFIAGFCFRKAARRNRAADEAAGIDYTDFPYGK